MCGEMAGDKRFTRLLLGLGLREFSLHPANLLEIKQVITQSSVKELETLANRSLTANSGVEVAALLDQPGNTIH